jgi:hypothetical protein
MKKNCWELKKCVRELGGNKILELGICPESTYKRFNGVYGGINSGRVCWLIAGTSCGGKDQGLHADEQAYCAKCDVYMTIKTEEGDSFNRATDFLEIVSRQVNIDIKPDSDTNSINISSAGMIPVAILCSDTFDATTVDPDTISLAGARVKMVGKSGKYLSHEEDVNGDGLLDLVSQVYTAQFMVEIGGTVAVLEAATFDGTPIRGEDSINIVPDN